MSKGIAPITSTNDINAIVRQVNQNFQILANRSASGGSTNNANSAVIVPGSVTDNSQFAVYYDASGLARVVIGTVSSTGEEVIAISNEGVNVLNALRRNPISSADFYFNSSIVMSSIGSLTSRISAAENDISSIGDRLTTAEGDISDLKDRVDTLETKMEAAELELADHESRIEALENA